MSVTTPRNLVADDRTRRSGQLTDALAERELLSTASMLSQAVVSLSDSELIANTRELLRQSGFVEAELLVHLGEIDGRELYLERACSSMLAFCVEEFGFSEDAAYTRIRVARAARALPAMIEAVRSGSVHLTGLRLLAPHLTPANHRDVLARAAGKKKEAIEELIVSLAPRPPAPTVIRKIPNPTPESAAPEPGEAAPLAAAAAATSAAGQVPGTPPDAELSVANSFPGRRSARQRDVVAPLSQDAFRIQFTATRSFRDKLRKAQGLLRHRVPKGEVGIILERALDALIERVEKERFGIGRKPRRQPTTKREATGSRKVPVAMSREAYIRDERRCTYRDKSGRRCTSTDVEIDHVDGFARVRVHSVDRLRLLCRAHNQYTAKKMYGRAFMERKRAAAKASRAAAKVSRSRTRSGTSSPSRPKKGERPLRL